MTFLSHPFISSSSALTAAFSSCSSGSHLILPRASSSARQFLFRRQLLPSVHVPTNRMLSAKTTTTAAATTRKSRSFSTTSKTSSASSSSLSSTASSSSSSLSDASNKNKNNNNNKLISQRGSKAVGLLPSYLADARSVEKYDPVAAPQGALQLGVAESQLLEDLLLPQINALQQDNTFTSDCIYYQPTAGRASLRDAVALYIQNLTQCPKPLDTEGLVVGAGCNAVLENLCFCIANPGDSVLIPTPYYAAFEFDLVARAGLEIVPVNTFQHSGANVNVDTSSSIPQEAYYPTRAALDAAAQQAPTPPRILLLSHPHNPLGICYPPSVVQECIDWCNEHEVHLISDEIYAGSVYRGDTANFHSALELAASTTTTSSSSSTGLGLGPYVHWVYAMSKDFALSGLRVGVVYTENEDIRMPLQKLNDMSQMSSQTQVLVENMMTAEAEPNVPWTRVFREENHKRLRARGDLLHASLTNLDIPYLPATSGLFCWIDLSQFLPSSGSDQERERALYLELVQEFGLLLTPGLSMRNERPGFFRCVFTAAKDSEFELALQRLERFVQAKRS